MEQTTKKTKIHYSRPSVECVNLLPCEMLAMSASQTSGLDEAGFLENGFEILPTLK